MADCSEYILQALDSGGNGVGGFAGSKYLSLVGKRDGITIEQYLYENENYLYGTNFTFYPCDELSCFVAHSHPFCLNKLCEASVCGSNSSCCSDEWGSQCVDLANNDLRCIEVWLTVETANSPYEMSFTIISADTDAIVYEVPTARLGYYGVYSFLVPIVVDCGEYILQALDSGGNGVVDFITGPKYLKIEGRRGGNTFKQYLYASEEYGFGANFSFYPCDELGTLGNRYSSSRRNLRHIRVTSRMSIFAFTSFLSEQALRGISLCK